MPEKRYIECPFCNGLVEPGRKRMQCPECHAEFVYDDQMETIFVDTHDLRLPVHGTVCTQCGLLQSEKVRRCIHCGVRMIGTEQ